MIDDPTSKPTRGLRRVDVDAVLRGYPKAENAVNHRSGTLPSKAASSTQSAAVLFNGPGVKERAKQAAERRVDDPVALARTQGELVLGQACHPPPLSKESSWRTNRMRDSPPFLVRFNIFILAKYSKSKIREKPKRTSQLKAGA